MGFFTQMERRGTKVVKSVNGRINWTTARDTIAKHDAFVRNLRFIGINVPETTMKFEQAGSRVRLEIEQEGFEAHELARNKIMNGRKEEVLSTMGGIISDALKFADSPKTGQMGFHPTVRNYAVRDGKFYILDTFPPFGEEREVWRIAARHAPTLPTRAFMTVAGPLNRVYTKQCYDPATMVAGIVASTVRLRPELKDEIIAHSRELITAGGGVHKATMLRAITPDIGRDRFRLFKSLYRSGV